MRKVAARGADRDPLVEAEKSHERLREAIEHTKRLVTHAQQLVESGRPPPLNPAG